MSEKCPECGNEGIIASAGHFGMKCMDCGNLFDSEIETPKRTENHGPSKLEETFVFLGLLAGIATAIFTPYGAEAALCYVLLIHWRISVYN